MAYAPCKNTNCQSYGKPHPNCKCYGGMADGGIVAPFCSESRLHDVKCKYYAEGGEVDQDSIIPDQSSEPIEIDQDSIIPDEPIVDQKTIVPDQTSEPVVNQQTVIPNSEKYSSPIQQAATIAEGIAQGVPGIGPLATAGEIGLSKLKDKLPPELGLGLIGTTAEDIAARAEANPNEHLIAKGIGLLGTTLPAGKAASLGAAALNGFLTNAAVQGSDEATNWLLNQQDHETPVGSALLHMGAAGLLGSAFGGASKFATNKLQELSEKQIGTRVGPFLEGVASAANGKMPSATSEEAEIGTKIAGAKFYNSLVSKPVQAILGGGALFEAAREGYNEDGATGALKKAFKVGTIELLAKTLGPKMVAPFMTKILSSGHVDGLSEAVKYATDVKKGYNKVDKGLESLFSGTSKLGQTGISDVVQKENREKLKDWLDEGGHHQDVNEAIQGENERIPGYAKGGEVNNPQGQSEGLLRNQNGIAAHFPEQNILLNVAKGRISNYLQTQKPMKNAPKLAFDHEPDNREQTKTYNKALDIALNPLSVLNKIKSGTLEMEDVRHLKSMYPEASSLIQKKMVDKISQAQMDGKKPSYTIRQGMSMFLGAPLSSEMLPQNIQAAQAVFQLKKTPQQSNEEQPKTKKNTSSLAKMDNQYLTPNQARQAQQQKV